MRIEHISYNYFYFGSDRRGDLLWRSTDNIVMTIFDKGDREYIIDFSDERSKIDWVLGDSVENVFGDVLVDGWESL